MNSIPLEEVFKNFSNINEIRKKSSILRKKKKKKKNI